jgi:CitMHS family citrate-Mg2+:H+ or citrate-Ca2+:H+ symporter
MSSFYHKKWILFALMVLIMLIPGALTGAGSVSIFVVGGIVAKIMQYMGLSKVRTAGFIYVTAMLSAAAPPINLWAMIMAAGANMPYVGFTYVLLVPIVIIAVFTIIYFCRGGTAQKKEDIIAQIPQPPKNLTAIRIALPLLVLVALFLLSQFAAFSIPILGLPLMFILCTIVTILINPQKTSWKRYYEIIINTMEQVFPLLATVISVGVLVNVMTATGVRGLISITFITLPLFFVYATVLIFGPLAQGSLSYGSAIIIGVPIIFLFNTMGINNTVVAAAMSLIFPLGDCLPPSMIVGRVTIETVGYEGKYTEFLRTIAIPWLFMGCVALLMLIFANRLSFLVI